MPKKSESKDKQDKKDKQEHFCAFCYQKEKTRPHLEIKELQICGDCSFEKNLFQIDTPDNAKESLAFGHIVKINELALSIYKILDEKRHEEGSLVEFTLIKVLIEEIAQLLEDWDHYG